MRKEIIILCTVAALVGCSRQGGSPSTERGGTGSRYDTNTGGGSNPTNTNTNRINNPDSSSGSSGAGSTPQGAGTQ